MGAVVQKMLQDIILLIVMAGVILSYAFGCMHAMPVPASLREQPEVAVPPPDPSYEPIVLTIIGTMSSPWLEPDRNFPLLL